MGDEQPTFRKFLLPTVEESLLDTAMRIPTTGICGTVRDSKVSFGKTMWLAPPIQPGSHGSATGNRPSPAPDLPPP